MTSLGRRLPWNWVVLAGFTLLALLPGGAPRALDARTGLPVPGVHLELPALSVALEPLAAPLHIVAGSPDYRQVGGWMFAWVTVGFGLAGWRGRRVCRGMTWGAAGCLGLLFWLAIGVFLPIPGWRLKVDDPRWLIADLQSHTLASHDGLVSAADNLWAHAANGYNVVAVTDHNRPEGGLEARRLAGPQDPAVLAGVEVRSPMGAYLLGIGLKSGAPVVGRRKGDDDGFEQRFIDNIHRDHGGVVLVLSYRLEPGDPERLAAEGVDGFEIANFGHPAPPKPVMRALRRAARARGLPLVASSDWHGWGGWFRTWTLMRNCVGNHDTGRAVLEALRSHRAARVVPVVAGPMGAVTGWRAAAAPLTETVRYVRGLSPGRLGVWTLWIFGWIGLQRAARCWVCRPGFMLGALGVVAGSLVLWWRGVAWLAAGTIGGDASHFPAAVGYQLLVAALAGLIASWLLGRRANAAGREHVPTTTPRFRIPLGDASGATAPEPP